MHATNAYLRSFRTLHVDVDLYRQKRRRLPRHVVVQEVQYIRTRRYRGSECLLDDYVIWFCDDTFDRLSFAPLVSPPQPGEYFPRSACCGDDDYSQWTDPNDLPEPVIKKVQPVKFDPRTDVQKHADAMYPEVKKPTRQELLKRYRHAQDMECELGYMAVKIRRPFNPLVHETLEHQRMYHIALREDPDFVRQWIKDPNAEVPEFPLMYADWLTLNPPDKRLKRPGASEEWLEALHIMNLDDLPELGVDVMAITA